MSYVVKRKVGNNRYAYEVAAVWDKKKKMSVQKVLRYLGPVGEDGKIREKTRKPSMVLDCGDVMVAKSIFDGTQLPAIIERLPFEDGEKRLIELMVLNKVVMPQPDYLLRDWTEGNYLNKVYGDVRLDSREISRMLSKIGRKDIHEIYFDAVRETVKIKDVMAYDLTSLPTSVDLILSEWGRCGNGKSKIVKLAVFFDVKSKTPLYFRLITGNVQDVSTLSNMLEHVRNMAKNATFCMVMDRGFYSSQNIEALKAMKVDFMMPVPRSTSLFYDMIGKNKDIVRMKNQFLLNGKYCYGTKSKNDDDDGLFVYVFYSPQKFSHDVEATNRKAVFGKCNDDEEFLDKKLGAAGYAVIVSTLDLGPEEIMRRYYQRYYLEKSHSYLKSKIRMLPLRHHSEETALAHVFISTLSLSLYWTLQEKLEGKYSLPHALLLLRRIKANVYDNGRVFLTEIGKKEREILKLAGVDLVAKICGN